MLSPLISGVILVSVTIAPHNKVASSHGSVNHDAEIVGQCEVDKDKCVTLQFAVADSGPGISAQAVGHLFKPFMQVGVDDCVTSPFKQSCPTHEIDGYLFLV